MNPALTKRKYRRLFSPKVRKKPGPRGPTREVMAAVVDMKLRNPTWGCPRTVRAPLASIRRTPDWNHSARMSRPHALLDRRWSGDEALWFPTVL